jgi:spore coat polysaccharide biosynthesis protein SpsF
VKTGVVIQARMGSTRLPGKVLKTVDGWSLLELCATRAARSRHAEEVVVATSSEPRDDPVAEEAARLGLPCVRGSEEDVLSRFHLAAVSRGLDVLCRVTADCPFTDPDVLDAVFAVFFECRCDYASNTLRRTFPRGLDAEVFSFRVLEQAHREAREAFEREHVTPYIYGGSTKFSLRSVECGEDLSAHRWTVDEEPDLQLIREIAARLCPLHGGGFGYRDVLAALGREPGLALINAHVAQKAG